MDNYFICKQTAWNHTHDYRAALHEQQADLYNLINAMGDIIAVHDSDTTRHHANVAKLAELFAEFLNLPDDQAAAIYYAGLVHDYGKVYVSRDVLNKPGPLTEQEYDEVKKHSAYTAESVGQDSSTQEIRSAIRAHHERWDGRGYPDGLAGGEIPLAARILAIADAFDAMTSSHPYKAAYTWDEALNELSSLSGTQFDPDLVPEFLKMISSITIER